MKEIAELLDHERPSGLTLGEHNGASELLQTIVNRPHGPWNEDDELAWQYQKLKHAWHILVRQTELPKNWCLIPDI